MLPVCAGARDAQWYLGGFVYNTLAIPSVGTYPCDLVSGLLAYNQNTDEEVRPQVGLSWGSLVESGVTVTPG